MSQDRAAALLVVLEEAKELGFLGPGPVEAHIAHARGFLELIRPFLPGRVVDLGSGGGIPGLVLAMEWAGEQFEGGGLVALALVDANQRRVAFLRRAVTTLRVGDVEVIHRRGEELGRDAAWRGRVSLVVARSFGPPPVLAECAAPLLRLGGQLVVSEPPERGGEKMGPARWPEAGVRQLGLRSLSRPVVSEAHYQVFRQEATCPARYPRRVGIPAKRPLF